MAPLTLARRAERGAGVSCILVLNPATRRLAESISLPPFPVLALPLDAPDAVALRCLERLQERTGESGLAAAVRMLRALDGQAVGRRFFEAFRTVLKTTGVNLASLAAGGVDEELLY